MKMIAFCYAVYYKVNLMMGENYIRLATELQEMENLTIKSPEASNTIENKVVIGGWRMIKSEVFIPPRFRGVLSALVGNGVHLLAIVSSTLFLD